MILFFETAIALILVLGILVIFHEMGHFTAARLCGIRVEEFAFGFGPKLIRLFKRGDTEYTIHPFPLGGFVKLAGMEPGEESIADGFQAQAIWKRAIVIFAGPFASLLLAVLVFVAVGVLWGFPDDAKQLNRIAMVSPHTIAQKIDLKAGDTILSINGSRIKDGNQMIDLIHSKPGQKLNLVIDRNGEKMEKTAAPSWVVIYLGSQWTFTDPARGRATGVLDDSPAAKAGLKTDDVLVSINGRQIDSGQAMASAAEQNNGKPVELELKRGNSLVHTKKITPDIYWVQFMGARWLFPDGYATGTYAPIAPGSEASIAGIENNDQLVKINGVKVKSGMQMMDLLKSHPSGKLDLELKRNDKLVPLSVEPTPAQFAAIKGSHYQTMGQLGFQAQPVLIRMSFLDSVKTGLQNSWRTVGILIYSLAPSRIGESVGGPVMIAKQTSSMVVLGPYYVIYMMGLLSLSLGFINLVPIPVVDGGHLAILGIEAVRRKRLTAEQMQVVQFVGLIIIAALFVVVFWSDIFKLHSGSMPQ